MEDTGRILFLIAVMAVTTYLIRMLPLALFQKSIENRFIKSFLYYVPYACLTAMTVPAIFYATKSPISAAIGFVVACILGLKGRSLPVVACAACLAVFIVERFL